MVVLLRLGDQLGSASIALTQTRISPLRLEMNAIRSPVGEITGMALLCFNCSLSVKSLLVLPVRVDGVDLSIAGRVLLGQLHLHPDQLVRVREPRGDQVHAFLYQGADVSPVGIRNTDGQTMVYLFDKAKFFSVGRATWHAARVWKK